MGTQSKRKKGTKDNRSITSDLKRESEQDANRTALLPTFDSIAYSPAGISQTDYVDVSDSIDPLQTGSPPAAGQVTGLTVTPQAGSYTQLNLSWTAVSGANIYNVYRSTTSGFTPDITKRVAQVSPPTTTFQNTGLVSGTTYYYKVSAENAIGEGLSSAQVSGTTAGLQILGLTVTVAGDTELQLDWTAVSDATSYKVYRSTTSGFTVSSGTLIASPTTNSYDDTGRTAGTTYYYRVSGVNVSFEGTPSSQVSGTTTGAPPPSPDFWLKLEVDPNTSGIIDAMGNITTGMAGHWNSSTSPRVVAGKFGNAVAFTHPTYVSESGYGPDLISINDITFTQMDTTNIGFSFSCWIYPTDMTGLDNRRQIAEKRDSANNQWALNVTSGGRMQFQVKKGGTDYRREKTGFVVNQWQHVVVTFNASNNSLEIYRNAVAGQTSTGSYQYKDAALNNFVIACTQTTDILVSEQSYFKGYIDEIQYFKGVVLTQAQITNLMNLNHT